MADQDSKRCGIILDGYTVDTVVPECEFHPEVSLTFRPMSKLQVADTIGRIAKHRDNPVKGEEIAAEVMAKQIKSWSLQDHEGNAVPVNADMMKLLEPHLSAKIFDLIRGEEVSIKRDEDLKN